MKVKDYLQQFPEATQVTFIKLNAGDKYSTTPVLAGWEWMANDAICDYLVINADHPPIDISGTRGKQYKDGGLKCAVITTEALLLNQYGEKQGCEMVKHYERTVR